MLFDLLIIGGGLVGSSLASALNGSALRLGLIDQQAPQMYASSDHSSRALVLSAPSIDYLKQLMIWRDVASEATPITVVEVSKQGVIAKTRFRARDEGLKYLAQVIEADRLMIALNQKLSSVPKVELFYEKTIISLQRIEQGWKVVFSDGQSLTAKLLVAADGSESWIRKTLGIATERFDLQKSEDQHSALMLNIALAQSHQNVAYERFLNKGSIAMIPFGSHQVKCIWISNSDEILKLQALAEPLLLERIQHDFGYRLGLLERIVGRVHLIPLQRVFATSIYDQGLVLIGNAANTLYPIAAQGFNLGLRDAITLAKILKKAPKDSIGSIEVLRPYALTREKDQARTRQWTDCLANHSALQEMGLWGSNVFPPLKHWMTRQGLGIGL